MPYDGESSDPRIRCRPITNEEYLKLTDEEQREMEDSWEAEQGPQTWWEAFKEWLDSL